MREANLVGVRVALAATFCASWWSCADETANRTAEVTRDATSPDGGGPGSFDAPALDDAADGTSAADGNHAADGGNAGDDTSTPDGADSGDSTSAPDGADAADVNNARDANIEDAPDAKSPTPEVTTQEVLSGRGPGCLPCAVEAGALDTTNGLGINCEQADAADAVQNCLDTLRCIFNSGCASPPRASPVSCLCGTVDKALCSVANATTPLNGACAQDYYAGFGTKDVAQFWGKFEDPSTAPGRANSLAVLLYDVFVCTGCFQGPTPGGDAGPDGGRVGDSGGP